MSVRQCWECRPGSWNPVTLPQGELDMEASGSEPHRAHDMLGVVPSTQILCTGSESKYLFQMMFLFGGGYCKDFVPGIGIFCGYRCAIQLAQSCL